MILPWFFKRYPIWPIGWHVLQFNVDWGIWSCFIKDRGKTKFRNKQIFWWFLVATITILSTLSQFLSVLLVISGCLDLIPSPSVKIQTMGGKVSLRCKGKTLLGKLSTSFWKQKVCWQPPSNDLPLHLKETFPPILCILTEGEGIESRLPFKIISTLPVQFWNER